MVQLTDSIDNEMTSQISQLSWENLTVTMPVEDDECSRKVWCKLLRKKSAKMFTILKGGNILSTLKCNEKQIYVFRLH